MNSLYIEKKRKSGIQLPLKEHIEIQNLLRPILLKLWDHENEKGIKRNTASVGFPYCVLQQTLNGPIIGLCQSGYTKILNQFFELVSKKQYDPDELLDILLPDFSYKNRDEKIEFFREEQCSYYVIMDGGNIGRVLRLDFFRDIRFDKKTAKYEFIGGLFHSLEHFEVEDKSASNYYDLKDIYDLPFLIASAFAGKLEKSKRNDTDYETYLFLPNGKRFKAIFYLEEESGVYSLRSFYPDNEKKNKKIVTPDYPM